MAVNPLLTVVQGIRKGDYQLHSLLENQPHSGKKIEIDNKFKKKFLLT